MKKLLAFALVMVSVLMLSSVAFAERDTIPGIGVTSYKTEKVSK